MIAMLSGEVVSVRGNSLVIRAGDFAFEVRTSPQLLMSSKSGSRITLHTRMHVREDEISLFGFESDEELRVFDLLCTVSGIGPKIALGALGSVGASEISRAIVQGDEDTLLATPGIGSKTAKLILLSLAGKLNLENESFGGSEDAVVTALTGLGVASHDAQKLVSAAKQSLGLEADSAALLKEALRLRRS